ncbi:MAG: Zn-ribbon domain-containing OB-fold protein [Cupriavidus necator]
MYKKPLPVLDAETVPFWEALRRQRLVVKRCHDCARYHFYPRVICPFCHSEHVEWAAVSGKGEIYSFTIARRPAGPAFGTEVPYVVAVVQLEEGPRMMTNILCADPAEVRIGMRVVVDFQEATEEITLPMFRPVPMRTDLGA